MLIYVAGPLETVGNVGENIRAALELAHQVRLRGHIPYIPHLLWFGHALGPRPIPREQAMRECIAMLRRADGILRLDPTDGSTGSDEEEQEAKLLGLPIWRAPAQIPARPVLDWPAASELLDNSTESEAEETGNLETLRRLDELAGRLAALAVNQGRLESRFDAFATQLAAALEVELDEADLYDFPADDLAFDAAREGA